jgi:site-specific recombinase XerD
MLKNGASLGSIAQILGHSDINVTGTYLRVDIEQLRICGLGLGVTR